MIGAGFVAIAAGVALRLALMGGRNPAFSSIAALPAVISGSKVTATTMSYNGIIGLGTERGTVYLVKSPYHKVPGRSTAETVAGSAIEAIARTADGGTFAGLSEDGTIWARQLGSRPISLVLPVDATPQGGDYSGISLDTHGHLLAIGDRVRIYLAQPTEGGPVSSGCFLRRPTITIANTARPLTNSATITPRDHAGSAVRPQAMRPSGAATHATVR
jgi:hypothetical protein